MDRYWATLSDFCAECSMQYSSGMLRLLLFWFPANKYVIAVFSRPIGAAVPGFETGNSKVDIRYWSAVKSSKDIVITPHLLHIF